MDLPAAVARFRADLSRLCDPDAVRLLVAVSGGPDSLALLLLGRALLGDRCSAATVDHRVRAASTEEARFVAALCRERGIRHHVLSDPDADDQPATGNLPTRLRLLRYSLLNVELDEAGADLLATAHHLDDQVETVVMRLNRGSGVAGLAGIRERQGRIIRPLLNWRRAELATVVEAHGVRAIADPSNVDDRYDRARLRKALAGAEWLDPARIARTARSMADAEDALAWAARQAADRHLFLRSPTEATLFPGALPFELLRRLTERCLHHVEPTRRSRGGEIAALVTALSAGRPAMLGDVAGTVEVDTAPYWLFRPAPPRRSR